MNFKNILMAITPFFILSCGAISSENSEKNSVRTIPIYTVPKIKKAV